MIVKETYYICNCYELTCGIWPVVNYFIPSRLGDYRKYAQRDRLPILYAVIDAIATTANISSIRISSVEVSIA